VFYSHVCMCVSQALHESLVHYEVRGLGDAASLQLLRRFHRLTGEQLSSWSLLEAERELLQACSGLPLALEVIGGALMVSPSLEEDVRKTWAVSCAKQTCRPTAGWALCNKDRR